jgi:2OG-Fe(II) oxygenase superfamily
MTRRADWRSQYCGALSLSLLLIFLPSLLAASGIKGNLFAASNRAHLLPPERDSTNDLQRSIQIINEADAPISVDWINPTLGTLKSLVPRLGVNEAADIDLLARQSFAISYADKPTATQVKFKVPFEDRLKYVVLIRPGLQVVEQDPFEELPAPTTDSMVYFEVMPEPTGFVTQKEIQTTDRTSADEASSELVDFCRQQAFRLGSEHRSSEQSLDHLSNCLEERLATLLEAKNAELAFQSQIRQEIAGMAEDYTCADPYRESSPPIEIRTWSYEELSEGNNKVHQRDRLVHVLHNRPRTQIHLIHDFISEEECAFITQAANATLHRGTVADGKGGSRLSDSRKAWQAGLAPGWETNDPIAAVTRRLFTYANDIVRYNMSVAGQEELMSIQYFGRGNDDPTPDRYKPHCDGACSGLPHKAGERVATMVMYCDVPTVGGATNFQQANVYVKPRKGAAAFFSYMDPVAPFVHDDGFTQHSGCPVIEGTKRIAVQWMRVGVDDDNPWDSFDTNTVSKRAKDMFLEEDDDVGL